ncbi:MAG: nitroreductase family protein [Oscillospiraceae bacterium]|nr:nitroreductase family protein [Oscillospiraceae bacterium]
MDNQAVQALLERRSIRSIDPDRQLTPEQLEVFTRIATTSPSARNNQRYHFTVVQNPQLLEHMSELIRQQMMLGTEEQKKKASAPGYSPLHHAPTVVFITGDLKASFHVQTDCGIAAGLIVAAATEMGLASCVTASSLFMFKSDEGTALRQRLQIPEGYQTVCTVALGYLKGDKLAEPAHKNPAELLTMIQ